MVHHVGIDQSFKIDVFEYILISGEDEVLQELVRIVFGILRP